MVHTVKSIVLDITGKRKPAMLGRVVEVEDDSGQQTPDEKVAVKTG